MDYEAQETKLKAEKEILLKRLDAMLAQIKDLALDSISEDMHLVEYMGKVESLNHDTFLRDVLESYLNNSDEV